MAKIKTQYGQPTNYNATPATRADGQGGAFEVDASGNLKTISGGTGASSNQVQGTAADNAAAVGNPVQVGGVYNTAAPTYANGDVAARQVDVNGNEKITSGTATGATTPGTALLAGMASAGTLMQPITSLGGIGTDGVSGSTVLATGGYIYNGATYDRLRSVVNATNSTGAGIASVGLVAQLDDTSPTTITENSFGNLRMGTSRQLLMDRMSPYPYLSTPVTNSSGNVANASAVATLAGVASKTTYITGFEITASGATAASVVSVTVTGTISGTMTYTFVAPAGATTAATPLTIPFPVAIPASAANTGIVVTLPALGAGNTNATVVAHGYQL